MIYIAVIETHAPQLFGILKKNIGAKWKWVGLKLSKLLLCAAI